MPSIEIHQFANGLTLLGEPMPWLESAAFSISVPAGARLEPESRLGLANLLCEMVERGAGERDSRAYLEALEYLGVDGSSSANNSHISFSGAMPADALLPALEIYADVLRRPHLPEAQLPDAKRVCLQEILALEDDLAQQVLLELRRRHYPHPLGRSVLGTPATIDAISLSDVQGHFERFVRPQGTILSVAGKIDFPRVVDQVERCLGDWQMGEETPVDLTPAEHGYGHLQHDSQQTHIAVAFPTVPYRHPDYYKARGAVGVLSDGMSCRLFTELRERRGLCYTVYASLHSLREQACVVAYVGTSSERAQESLDVLLEQLRGLHQGITAEELDRLKIQIRSSLVMQQESSRSRASAIAGDWYHLGRTRTLAEVQEQIDALTVPLINDYLEQHPAGPFDIVTLGPSPLELHHEV